MAGEGGDNFAGSMQAAVEQTLGPLPPNSIQHRLSSHQRFLSVTIGPVTVHNSDQVCACQLPQAVLLVWRSLQRGQLTAHIAQVIEVYQTMKRDSRLKFCM